MWAKTRLEQFNVYRLRVVAGHTATLGLLLTRVAKKWWKDGLNSPSNN